MARHNGSIPIGKGRLLDVWVPPSDAGPPIGCVATSYTFDSVFFEEECLARFAGIRSGAAGDERGVEWLVEREEKLAQIKAVVLVDKDHCRGVRSPRWDLLCARGSGSSGIMHAKLSLLVWTNCARLVAASANLTPSGYRRNREVFTMLDIEADKPLAAAALLQALDYLALLFSLAGSEEMPQRKRATEVIHEARTRINFLQGKSPEPEQDIYFHGIGPGQLDLFTRLKEDWQAAASGVVRELYVVSPFFDAEPASAQKTAQALWELGAERGEVQLILSAPVEQEPDGRKLFQAPAAFGSPPRGTVSITPYGVPILDAEAKERRPLHAKMFGMQNDTWVLMACGSSNMTQAGTGLSSRPNWEAMVSVLIRRESDEYKIMKKMWSAICGQELEKPFEWQGTARDLEVEVAQSLPVLPSAFKNALYRCRESNAELEITLDATAPLGWELRIPVQARFADEPQWVAAGSPQKWILPWQGKAVPSGLLVIWPLAPQGAWLPVCVENTRDLPPPEELRALPLELLIEILTTARPLVKIVAAYLRAKGRSLPGPRMDLDPHKRVDVSGYLIPRTRRVSKALQALRQKLEEPCATKESLNWRLRGPFGAKALIDAIKREAQSADECCFFNAELCLELSDLKPAEGGLKAAEIKIAVSVFVTEQIAALEVEAYQIGSSLKTYILDALAQARSQV